MQKKKSQSEPEKTIRDEVLDLIDSVNESYFEVGRRLSEISRDGLAESWGFGSFGEYCEVELGFKRRKAFYFIAIYENSVRIELYDDDDASEKIQLIGWTKAVEILRFVETVEQFHEWADRAHPMTRSHLVEALRLEFEGAVTKKAKDEDGNKTFEHEDETFHVIEVSLSDDQYDNVKLAMGKASAMTKSDKDGHNLDMICLDFLSNNTDITDIGEKMEDWANRGHIVLEDEEETDAEALAEI